MERNRPGGELKGASAAEPTRSQLLPFAGEWQALTGKAFFVPAVAACLVIAALFSLLQNGATFTVNLFGAIPVAVPSYTIVLALAISAGGGFVLYRLVGKPTAWWVMPAVAAFTGALAYSPVLALVHLLDPIFGAHPKSGDGFAISFIKMFFLAGLPEEVLKAIPVALGVVIGIRLLPQLRPDNPLRRLAVLEPLDGILLGAAAGLGFAFAETILQYVPKIMVDSRAVSEQLIALLAKLGAPVTPPQDTSYLQDVALEFALLAKRIGFDRASFELQQIVQARSGLGLQLMIPRLLSDVFGHAAYAGVFGYFIGLAALKPAQRAKTIAIGLAIAAGIHGLWDAIDDPSAFMMFGEMLLAFGLLAITIAKGRALSPHRSQLVASQLVDRAVAARDPAPARAPAAPAPQAAATPQSMTWDDHPDSGLIEIGAARVPVAVGARLYERQTPGARAARGDGIVAEVSANPNDGLVLGLKNLSNLTWKVTMADGAARELAPHRSIRLMRGLRIQLGDLVAEVK